MTPTADSLSVIAGWIAGALLFLGIGELAARWLLGRDAKWTRTEAFWLGFTTIVGALQLWHFFLPIDARPLALLAPFALLGLRQTAVRARGEAFPKALTTGVFGALALALISWSARRALLPPLNGDVCLYHMEAVRWASQYPLVTGVANLNFLFGRNISYSLYVALLDVGPFFHRAQHLANGLLFLGVALPALWRTLDLFGRSPRRSSYLWAVAFGLSLDQLLLSNLSSPAADGATWCLLTIVPLFALEPVIDGQPFSESRLRLVCVAAMGGSMMKPSSLLAAAVFVTFALGLVIRARGILRPRALASFALAIVVLFAAPWVLRGYVVSGYPLYPITAGNLHLAWRIPETTADRDREDVDAYNRYQRRELARGEKRGPWLGHWLEQEWLDDRIFLIPATGWLAGLLALSGLALSQRRLPALLPAVAPLAVYSALWLWLIPDTRWIGPMLWFGATATWLCVGELAQGVPDLGRRWLAVGAVLLIDFTAFTGETDKLFNTPRAFEPLPHEDFIEARLESGEPIHQARLCCTEAPCTLDASRARTRVQGDFSKGFLPF